MIAQQLPLMLFALPSGVVVDRLDRRKLMATVCLVRAAALALMGAAIATGHPTGRRLTAGYRVCKRAIRRGWRSCADSRPSQRRWEDALQ
jgi:hypothetical protein